jgi:drug/metabolite transporter (DMT)-like permease
MMQIAAGDFATQMLYAGYRFTIAGILVILFGSIGKKKPLIPQKKSWGKVLILSMFQTVGQYIFFYIGLAHTSGVKSSIIIGTNAFVAILVASLIFHQERLTARKVVGCIVGFAGVALITLNGRGMDFNMSFIGEGFMFLSTVAYAFSSVYFKRYAKEEDSFVLSGYQFLLGGIILSIVGYLAGGRIYTFDTGSAAMLIYLALVAAVAYTLWGILLKYNPISRVAVYGCMNPVIGVILSVLLLHEKDQASGMRSALALILVSIGIYIVNGISENRRMEDECISNVEKG